MNPTVAFLTSALLALLDRAIPLRAVKALVTVPGLAPRRGALFFNSIIFRCPNQGLCGPRMGLPGRMTAGSRSVLGLLHIEFHQEYAGIAGLFLVAVNCLFDMGIQPVTPNAERAEDVGLGASASHLLQKPYILPAKLRLSVGLVPGVRIVIRSQVHDDEIGNKLRKIPIDRQRFQFPFRSAFGFGPFSVIIRNQMGEQLGNVLRIPGNDPLSARNGIADKLDFAPFIRSRPDTFLGFDTDRFDPYRPPGRFRQFDDPDRHLFVGAAVEYGIGFAALVHSVIDDPYAVDVDTEAGKIPGALRGAVAF